MAATRSHLVTTVDATERFDGWRVVAAVFVLFVTSAGLGFYGLAVYLDAITDEQDFSTSSVSLATSMFFVVSAVVGRLIARPVEAGQIRQLVAVGAILSGVALALLGQVSTVWQLYLVYVLFAVGFGLSGMIPGTTLVTRWFHQRRSVALAVASTGLSVGGLTLTQLASWMIDRYGMATATPWLGLFFVVIALATVPFMWPDPASRGQRPDGHHTAAATSGLEPPPSIGIAYEPAVQSRFFRAATAGYLLIMAAQVGGIAHLANLGTDRVDRTTGALAVLSLALASVVFRLLGGFLATRVKLVGFTVCLALLQGVSLVALAYADSRAAVVGAAFVMGATIGNLLMLQALLVAEAFGVGAYARLFSLNQLLVTFGVALGPFLVGVLEDAVSYRVGFWVAACCSVVGSLILASGGSIRATQAELTRA